MKHNVRMVLESKEALRVRLNEIGVEALSEQFVAASKPSIRWIPKPIDIPRIDHLGGLPTMPVDVPWPEFGGQPQLFIGQISMQSLQLADPTLMPISASHLCFFWDAEQQAWGYDPDDSDGWTVEYVSDPSAPRRDAPAGIANIFAEVPLVPRTELSVPSSEDNPIFTDFGLTGDVLDAYFRLCESDGVRTFHRSFGYPEQIQGSPFDDIRRTANARAWSKLDNVELEEFHSRNDHWTLLFQVDSDDNAGMSWGDVGRLYFCIRDEDLRARRFSSTEMVMQCY